MEKKDNELFDNLKTSLEEAEFFYMSDNETDLIVADSAMLEALDYARKEKKLLNHDEVFKDEQ